MKNHSTPFEQQGVTEESDLQDIFKLLAELDKSKLPQESNQEHSNKSHHSKRKDLEPPNSQQSEPFPVSLSNKVSAVVKKTRTPIKSIDVPIKQVSYKNQVEGLFNQQSNLSFQSYQEGESYNQLIKVTPSEQESFIVKNTSQRIAEKSKVVADLHRQLQEIQNRYNEKQLAFQQMKARQKSILSNILSESNMSKIKYYEYLDHINMERKKIAEEEVLEKNEPLIKILKEEQLKYKPKKKAKNVQTMSLSDEEESKLSQSMEKEKRYYFSVVSTKLEKEREKYESTLLTQYTKKVSNLPEERLASLSKESAMNQIKPLCLIAGSNSKIQQILAIDLQKCHQVRIKGIKFNPTTPNEQRVKIHEKLLQIIAFSRKLMVSPNHHIFNQKSTIFIPLSQVILRDDEILLVNECNHGHFSLDAFLSRLELAPGEQQLHVVRYIIRVCLKGIQEINTQLKHDNIVILPHNLYFNQKWELKLSNIDLNHLFFNHFKHIIHEDDYFYFPPEEKGEKHSVSLWSLGIFVYFLCYGGKPFQKYQPYHWKSREEFFMFNELQVIHRPNSYDKCKDFIIYCLNKKGPINFNEVCSEPFLSQIK